jgi:hypothetical protein
LKSFGLLRTNVGLTTNIKVMIDTNYKFSLDSIDSDTNLSFDKFKKVPFTKDNYYDELIPYFYKDLPADTAFSIKYENDVDTMSNDFRYQYDELYNYGARNIVNNKNYTEEYEYFAPLYITKNGLPKNFIIFRVDGSGIGTTNRSNFNVEIIRKLKTVKLFDLSKQSVLGEWLGKNFTDNRYFPDSPLDIDFRNLEFCRWNGIDYQNGGYTYKSLFIDDILDEEKEIFELEKFIFDSYKNNKVVFPNILNFSFLFDDTPSTPEIKRKWSINRYYGFYLNDLELVKTVSPYLSIPLRSDIIILNNSVTGDKNSVSNIIYSPSSENPFLQEWSSKRPFYVEYDGNYYKVEQFTETTSNQLVKVANTSTNTESRMSKDLGFSSSKFNKNASVIKKSVTTNAKSAVEDFGDVIVTKYKIITNLDLTGLTASSFNQNYAEIDPTNKLITSDGSSIKDYQIAGFDSADVWIIEIDGMYHNLVSIDNSIMLSTDYSFIFNQNDFIYKVRGESKKVSTVVDFNNEPKKFSIYKLNFCDIKDFDTRIVDTAYSKYEYEESTNITNTDETKMYLEDIRSLTDPLNLDDFIYKNQIINIPTSSEYTANYETFKIDGNDLSEIWRKNPVYCKWGFHKSLSANDLPYTLNNSLIFEDFNRTTNVYEPYPTRSERNLDYFYTINSATSSYVYHSLHIENVDSNNNIDTTFKFELNKYLNFTYSYFDSITSTTQSTSPYPYDYFTYLFSKSNKFFNGRIKENSNKYSYFNVGDESVPNHTLFRGMKFDIYEVSSITLNTNNKIDKINIKSSNLFDDYKFSILLSDDNLSPIFDIIDSNKIIGVGSLPNNFTWSVMEEWRMDKRYPASTGIGTTAWANASKVLHDDILYYRYPVSNTTNPIFTLTQSIPPGISVPSAPYTQGWLYYNNRFVSGVPEAPFWSPACNTYTSIVGPTAPNIGQPIKLQEPNNPSVVFNSGEYYKCVSLPIFSVVVGFEYIDFWNPTKSITTGYAESSVVIYKNIYYKSLINNNYLNPTTNTWTQSTTVYAEAALEEPTDMRKYKELDGLKWKIIETWKPLKQYNWNDIVVYNEKVYKLYTSSTISSGTSFIDPPKIGTEPTKSSSWRENRFKSFDSISGTNSIIRINNNYNILVGGGQEIESKLNNGIIIYINRKWKNILVNININDGTTPNISNSNRDRLYNDINQKLTASNFSNAINDITNKYGFSNYISYIIIDENNNIKRYSYSDVDGGNIKDLPYLLKCEEPDKLDVKVNSLFKRAVELPNTLNPIKKLDSGKIVDITQLNFYNNVPIAANIIENLFPPKVFENYHGNKNIISNEIYRYSGYYSPVFYDVQLFERDSNGIPSGGNYKFDTLLNDFGLMKERKIRKVNRKGNILRLGNVNDEKSIYPMLDEFGYSIYDFFIFSSTWDLKYYLETVSVSKNKDYLQKYTIDENVINSFDIVTPIVIPSSIGKTQDN